MNDQFIEGQDRSKLTRSQGNIHEVIDNTEDELEALNADWELVEEKAGLILDILVDAAQMLADGGLAEWDEENYSLQPALDDEPETIRKVRVYIHHALDDWYEVRNAANEAMADQTSGTYGGY